MERTESKPVPITVGGQALIPWEEKEGSRLEIDGPVEGDQEMRGSAHRT